ncbi:MAG: DNA adenine methylase [Rhodospirillaceae bacterium]|nr:MAG: DNA adenine methylase [Rhodospirillaceae bacterium]
MESNHQRPVAPVEPIAPWLGGKRHLAQRLVDLIAEIPHKTYVEPFIGMGGVFLRRHYAPPAEVINDINRDLVTMFRVAQRHRAAFVEAVDRWSFSSRDEFDRLKRTPPDVLTDIERAARFLYLQRQAFGGKAKNPSFGVDVAGGSRLRARAAVRHIEDLGRRLEGVIVECLPWRDLIDRYDRPDTLFYLDPPYWGCEKDYGSDFTRSDFYDLAARLRKLQGRFLLSLNDANGVRECFAGFHFIEVETTYSMGTKERGAGQRALELIISATPPTSGLYLL